MLDKLSVGYIQHSNSVVYVYVYVLISIRLAAATAAAPAAAGNMWGQSPSSYLQPLDLICSVTGSLYVDHMCSDIVDIVCISCRIR